MNASLKIFPKCAVLLAAFNGIDYIEEQILSILQQEKIDITIYVSVDLSIDGTENWFNVLARKDFRIRVLPYGERFGGAAKNFFRLIKDVNFEEFDYVAFADQDDKWSLNKLARAIDFLKNSEYSAYSSNVIAFWPNNKHSLIVKSQPQKQYDFIFEGAGPGCTYVIEVQLMNKIKEHMLKSWNLLQNVWLHDWFCYAFARANGYKWFIDPSPSMYYRQHVGNQVGAKKGLKAYLNRINYIINGFWFKQAFLIAKLVNFNSWNFIEWERGFTRSQLLRISLHASQCRRRPIEQIFFFLACWFLAIKGIKTDK